MIDRHTKQRLGFALLATASVVVVLPILFVIGTIVVRGASAISLEFLTAIHESRRYFERDRPWGLPLLDQFFVGISSGKVLGALTQISPSLDMLDSDQMELLRHLLLLLSPAAILALGPMLLKIRSSSAQRQNSPGTL